MNKIILGSALLMLASCSTPTTHPKLVSFTPASVVIDYSKNDLYQATSLAQQFCQSVGKDAQYLRTEKSSGWGSSDEKLAFFNCVESLKNHNQMSNSGASSVPIINNIAR